MRRTLDQAFVELRAHLGECARAEARPGIRIFVYPPEWEAVVLARFPSFAGECAAAGMPLAVVDVGQGLLTELERRKGFVDRLAPLERERPERLLHDLGEIAGRYLQRLLSAPLDPPQVARLLVNTGALGAFVSFSALANTLHEGSEGVAAPAVLAFPGEADDRSLSLLGLRVDANYRVPRV